LFKKHISEIETDFLQTICFYEGLDSNKAFAQEAVEELRRRGFEPELDRLDGKILLRYESDYEEINTQYLDTESFTVFELIWMVIYPITSSSVGKGEKLKKKQKRNTIILSLVLYSCVIGYSTYDFEKKNDAYVQYLADETIQDSIFVASQNWSGHYEFYEGKRSWELEIVKNSNKHSALLTILEGTDTVKLTCAVVVRGFGIEIFSDSVNTEMGIHSYTDLLFELEKVGSDTLTWWHTLKPDKYESINGKKGFK
jgi:hypothetical protein